MRPLGTTQFISSPLTCLVSNQRSSVIERLLDIIAHDTEIQDKLRNETTKSKEEDVLELPHRDAVVKETLRLYAPVMYLGRV
jgi:cytochrome P450